jgi:Rrf2 family protein
MLRLSKKADYALIAMKHLALGGDRAVGASIASITAGDLSGLGGLGGSSSAREIAELYDIPIELMAKVLQRLVQRGLLASQQGTRGGYQLARSPQLISVADVIQAIDGPVTVTACSTEDGQCEQFAKCNVRDPLWRVRERILAALGECTIAELAADLPLPAPARAAVLHTRHH